MKALRKSKFVVHLVFLDKHFLQFPDSVEMDDFVGLTRSSLLVRSFQILRQKHLAQDIFYFQAPKKLLVQVQINEFSFGKLQQHWVFSPLFVFGSFKKLDDRFSDVRENIFAFSLGVHGSLANHLVSKKIFRIGLKVFGHLRLGTGSCLELGIFFIFHQGLGEIIDILLRHQHLGIRNCKSIHQKIQLVGLNWDWEWENCIIFWLPSDYLSL